MHKSVNKPESHCHIQENHMNSSYFIILHTIVCKMIPEFRPGHARAIITSILSFRTVLAFLKNRKMMLEYSTMLNILRLWSFLSSFANSSLRTYLFVLVFSEPPYSATTMIWLLLFFIIVCHGIHVWAGVFFVLPVM